MNKIREDLEELTTQILLDNDMLYKVPVDVINIAKAYGINAYTAEFNNEVSGAIKYDDNTKQFEIIVNKNNAETRRRFTIAHELGHYFLHQDMLKNADVHIDTLYRVATQVDLQIKNQEKEVDYFAGALLMNKMVIEKLINDYSVEELADIFGVSYSAMTVRLNILGLF
jgi:Zn-dependent peptidase ImmA (M78 family)